ncbi:MAG: hypothetical protein AAFU67_18750, partial [Bacteroidota bacterium]
HSNSYQSFFRGLTIIHYALIAGLLLFSAVVHFLGMASEDDSLHQVFRFLVPAFAIMAILLGRLVSRKLLSTAKQQSSLNDKLAIFRAASMLSWSTIEGAGLFATVIYMLTSNQVMLLVALACAAYLFTLRPTPERAAADLQLTEGEYREISR